jgi:hypothetical protein
VRRGHGHAPCRVVGAALELVVGRADRELGLQPRLQQALDAPIAERPLPAGGPTLVARRQR